MAYLRSPHRSPARPKSTAAASGAGRRVAARAAKRRLTAGLHLAGGLAQTRLRHRPFILSHLVTSSCDARCATCLWRDAVAPERELSASTIAWLYREAAAAGIAQVVVWGGEPTLRPDLPRLLWAARDAGLVVTLISNGRHLPEYWPELRGAVDALILSLDDAGPAHDRLRGLPGLYDRLDDLAARLQADPYRPRLLVNTVLSRVNRGALRRVAPIAERWGAGLYFCPMETGQMVAGGFADQKGRLALAPEELREEARSALALKAAGYPLLSTDRYLHLLIEDPSLSRYVCRTPEVILTVGADGSVRDCLRRDRPLAFVQDLEAQGRPLTDVYALPRFQELLAEALSCTVCNNPDVIETSWLWELRPAMLEKMVRLATT